MGKHTTHTLTPTEIECGVTLEVVAELLPKGLFIENGTKFVLLANTSPALGLSTARCAFGGTADFLGFNQLTQPVYARMKPILQTIQQLRDLDVDPKGL